MTNTDDAKAPQQEALKPCPFCGGTDIAAWDEYAQPWGAPGSWRGIMVRCAVPARGGCGNGTALCATKAEAITAWNKRHAPSWVASASDMETIVQHLTGRLVGVPAAQWALDLLRSENRPAVLPDPPIGRWDAQRGNGT